MEPHQGLVGLLERYRLDRGLDRDPGGDAPAAPSAPTVQADGPAQPKAKVAVEVPADKVELIRRCAHLLGTGGEVAAEIEALAEPASAMTLEDVEKLIAPMLR